MSQSLVENNIYKESYMASLYYEHIYSHVFTDGTEMETRYRQLQVMETPLVSQNLFAIDGEIITIQLYNRLILFLMTGAYYSSDNQYSKLIFNYVSAFLQN